MIPSVDVSTLSVETPLYLWFLLIPAGLLGLWAWQLLRRDGGMGQCEHGGR